VNVILVSVNNPYVTPKKEAVFLFGWIWTGKKQYLYLSLSKNIIFKIDIVIKTVYGIYGKEK
jgi:hypothetical protein